ncbi:MAG: glutathione S-transferase N-terminal domain-containing protein, partial [Caulobacterales bacterium]|nr:glutathione S-transferase N-terminal domain-containing protein [Caulobacterales bacterium]
MIIIHKRFFDVLSRAMIVALMEKRAHIHIVEVPQFEDPPNLLAIDNRGRTPLLIDDMY